eukprot:TRINITY_DN9761_c0_g1_i1.p1 TRINITY_DN9761_c0_g1~~TRINITY_DN9761_c0_g1_i1.p1  ORF type:complete len:419 (-),score=137.92 TRINITY_DN9761_c0_g1_i1:230-1414(-)
MPPATVPISAAASSPKAQREASSPKSFKSPKGSPASARSPKKADSPGSAARRMAKSPVVSPTKSPSGKPSSPKSPGSASRSPGGGKQGAAKPRSPLVKKSSGVASSPKSAKSTTKAAADKSGKVHKGEGKGRGKGRGRGRGKSAKAKSKARAKAKQQRAKAGTPAQQQQEEQIEAAPGCGVLVVYKKPPSAVGIRKKLLAAIGDVPLEDAIEAKKMALQEADKAAEEAQAAEDAQAQASADVWAEFEEAKSSVQKAIDEEVAAALRLKSLRKRKFTDSDLQAQAKRQALMDARQRLAILEVVAINHAQKEELCRKKDEAMEAVKQAKQQLLEQKRLDKAALSARLDLVAGDDTKGVKRPRKGKKTEEAAVAPEAGHGQEADVSENAAPAAEDEV